MPEEAVELQNKKTKKQMKKTINKLGLASFLAIGIAAPYLYADCATYLDCGTYWNPDPENEFKCSGSNPQESHSSEAVANLYAGPLGSDACGTIIIIATGADTGKPCGATEIIGECS